MNEALTLVLAGGAGVMLGAVFFGGLWWTVQKGVASKQPALWFLGSLLVRMGIALAGFYFVSGGHWERLAPCLVGFVMARLVIARLVVTRSTRKKLNPPDPGGRPCALLPIR
jgi:F1F0 ATPase subunit 2